MSMMRGIAINKEGGLFFNSKGTGDPFDISPSIYYNKPSFLYYLHIPAFAGMVWMNS